MKTKFGPSGILIVLLAVLALALAPASSQAQANGNGDMDQDRDQIRDRDQLHECALDVPDLDRLRDRTRDRDRDRLHLLSLTPPIEENGRYVYRHRIAERAQHNWSFFPGLMFIWPGTF
jgi:hypothetical protein